MMTWGVFSNCSVSKNPREHAGLTRRDRDGGLANRKAPAIQSDRALKAQR